MRKISLLLFLAFIMTLALLIPVSVIRAQDPRPTDPEPPAPKGVEIEPGYFMTAAVTGLDFPTGIAIGNNGTLYIGESGLVGPAQILEADLRGNTTVIFSSDQLSSAEFTPPLLDVTYHNGWLWVTHRRPGANGWPVGAVSKFNPDDVYGTWTSVLTNLPSTGDHMTNEIVFGPDGRAYFGQGTATNSSVVGPDNQLITAWLADFPEFHDFVPVQLVLDGDEFVTFNPLTSDPNDQAVTPPYHPFNYGEIPSGSVVEAATQASPENGMIAGNGAIYSFDPADPGNTLRLESWGERNPFGVGIDPFNPSLLFVSNNGADIRSADIDGDGVVESIGARPIGQDYDDMFIVNTGGDVEFYGWPDYFHNPDTGAVVPVTDPFFCQSPGEPTIQTCPDFVLAEDFRAGLNPLPAFAQFELHSSANKFDFSTDKKFKHVGDIFVAETGSIVPITGADRFVGYKVVRVDHNTGEVHDFIVNTGSTADEIFNPDSFNKPIDVKFQEQLMLVVDFGIWEPALGLFQPSTGKIWIVSHGLSGVEQR